MTVPQQSMPSSPLIAQPVFQVDTSGNPLSGSAVSMVDGADVTQGSKADAAVTNPALSASEIALLKGLLTVLQGTLSVSGSFSATNPSIGTDGSGAPASSTQIGGSDGTNLQPLQVDGSKNLKTIEVNSTSINTHLSNIDTDSASILTNTSNTATNTSNINTHAASIDTATAASKIDLDTLAGIVSGGKGAVKAGAGDFADLATLAGIVSGAKAAIKSATNDIVDLATLLARLTDTFGTSTAISAATTLAAIPTTSGLAANSFATLANASYQDTFIVQINVASAFVGTIGFYGLLPDGSTLQQINAHQRATAINGNSTAINTGSALEQTWEGSIAGFKAVYVICSAFTSGAASVQLGLTAANYAHAILNTVASNITQVGGTTPQLDGGSSNRLGVSLYGKNSTAGDTPLGLDASGRLTTAIQAVLGTALAADQSNTELRISNYVTKTTAGDTALTLGQTTKVNSLPVTFASDQAEPVNTGTPTETAVSVGVGNTSVLASNANRKFLLLVNDSNNTIYITTSGTNAALNTGTRLNANGGSILFDRYVPTAAVKAIATAASSNLLVTEG